LPEPDTPLRERPWEDVERMIGVDDALQRVLAAVSPLEPESLPILDAIGRVTAADLIAPVDIPPFRNSAMDGYAVRAADTSGAAAERPVRLSVTGQIAAGQAARGAVGAGTAIRIMTGAPMPDGADAVIRFEETDEVAYGPLRGQRAPRDWIGITRTAKPLDNVREAGEDICRGSIAILAGTELRAAEIGVLASLNLAEVSVHRRPRVGILSTGNEVVDIGPPLQPGQIRNSNSYTLAALVLQAGGEPVRLGVARDDHDDLVAKLAAGSGLDLLVTSGGVSLGDYDIVKDVMRSEGEIAVWQVRMKPGKPLAFGRIGSTPILGLPGNPVASAVSFEQFAKPAILRMLGKRTVGSPTIEAVLTERIDNRGHRRHYVRARVERSPEHGFTVRPAGDQGAGVLSSLSRANALLIVPEHLEVAEIGSRLQVQLVDWSPLLDPES
jgi:molybdopterin molybdotransferase